MRGRHLAALLSLSAFVFTPIAAIGHPAAAAAGDKV
jgi:hypothetical protein